MAAAVKRERLCSQPEPLVRDSRREASYVQASFPSKAYACDRIAQHQADAAQHQSQKRTQQKQALVWAWAWRTRPEILEQLYARRKMPNSINLGRH
jgi:hypothetical protein